MTNKHRSVERNNIAMFELLQEVRHAFAFLVCVIIFLFVIVPDSPSGLHETPCPLLCRTQRFSDLAAWTLISALVLLFQKKS